MTLPKTTESRSRDDSVQTKQGIQRLHKYPITTSFLAMPSLHLCTFWKMFFIIGMSLSKPHTSGTVLRNPPVCIYMYGSYVAPPPRYRQM